MELVVGIVLTAGRNPYGYMIYDTRSKELAIVRELGQLAVYNPNKRNEYLMYNDKGKLLNNKNAKIVYLNGDEAFMYTHKKGYERFVGNLTDTGVVIVNPSTYTVYEVQDEEDVDNIDGIIDWDEDPHVVTHDNKIISLNDESNRMQRIPLAVERGKLTAVIVQSEDQDTVYCQACTEYRVCIELKSAGVRNVKDLTVDMLGRLTETYFSAELDTVWTTNALGNILHVKDRLRLSDGNYMLKCKAEGSFETNSSVVRGSRYNNVYVIIDSKDEVLLSLTSYTDIEDFLDILLSLDNNSNYGGYKEVYTLLSQIHLENPRVDLLWTGAGISRDDGGMYLLTHVKELDKDYWLRLLAVHNYEAFVNWAEQMESDNSGAVYRDMVDGIEGLIKKKPDCHSGLLEVRLNPDSCKDTQYRFAI